MDTEQLPALPQTEISEKPTLDTNGLSLSPGSFMEDMKAIEARQAAQVSPAVAPLEAQPDLKPVETHQPEPAVTQAQVEIPEKFKNPDGTPSVEKIEKSTVSATEAYERYRQKEIALQQKINSVNRIEKAVPQSEPQEPMTDFEKQINEDLARNQQNPGKVLSKLFEAAKTAAYEEAKKDFHEIKQETERVRMERELGSISQHDPTFLTEEGMDRLFQIRQEKPWLNKSPNPMEAAYREHLADSVMKQRVGQQVRTPNPKAPTPPPAAVVAVDRTLKPKVNYSDMSKEDLRESILSQSADKREAFFKSLGFK